MAGNATDHVLHEVQDHEVSWTIFERLMDGVRIPLFSFQIGGYEFQFTKFMFLELVAAAIILAVSIPLAKKIRTGGLPKGYLWNFLESILIFIRDDIARPNLDDPHPHHHHDDHGHGEHAHGPAEEHAADRFLPFLWTLFMFILMMNLLGMIPFLGSPTASIWVTGGLALISFAVMHGAAIAKQHGNVFAYLKSLWPKIDVPFVGPLFSLMIFVIELGGTVIKAGVLAVRLFANMFAGHMVLGMILFFIYLVGAKDGANVFFWSGVSLASVLGVVALSLLELFVAFLQAYVFTFLTALFMGMNLYPEH